MEELWNSLIKFLLILLLAPLALCLALQLLLAVITAMIPVLLLLLLLATLAGGLWWAWQSRAQSSRLILVPVVVILVLAVALIGKLVPAAAESFPLMALLLGVSSVAYWVRQVRNRKHRSQDAFRLRGAERTPFMPNHREEDEL